MGVSGVRASFLVLTVALAGCAGQAEEAEEESTGAEDPTVTAGLGSITGSVIDVEEQPVVGAQVALLDTEFLTDSDAAGAFTFNGLTPGTYTVAASKIGYEQDAVFAEVVAEAIAEVEIQLDPKELPPEVDPRTATETGYIQCSWNPYYFVNPCQNVLPNNKDHFTVEIDATTPLVEVFFELAWEPTSAATGQVLELDFCLPQENSATHAAGCVVDDNTGEFYAYESGPSPLNMTVSARSMPLNDTLTYETWVGAGLLRLSVPPVPPTPAVQQPFTLYITQCYYAPCPDGFTALPPGTP